MPARLNWGGAAMSALYALFRRDLMLAIRMGVVRLWVLAFI